MMVSVSESDQVTTGEEVATTGAVVVTTGDESGEDDLLLSFLNRVVATLLFSCRPFLVVAFLACMVCITCFREWHIGAVCGKHKAGSLTEWCPRSAQAHFYASFGFCLSVLALAGSSAVMKRSTSAHVLMIATVLWVGGAVTEYIGICSASASASLGDAGSSWIPLSQCPTSC
jgi:hypothetical protein